MPARTKLAQLIAREEGFGKPGAIPTVRHNPGDLRHSPHASHAGIDPDGIGKIDSDDHGWEDLERQLELYAERGLSVRQAVGIYAPPGENDTGRYLEFVCDGLGCQPDDPVRAVLSIPAGGS